jgi:iron-sulfur cluster assembly protein
MLRLTETAAAAVANLVEAEGLDEGGLRLTAERDEQGEIGIHIEVAPEPVEGDEVVDAHGARVFLDPSAADALDDKVLDAEAHGDHYHFSLDEQ